MSWYFNRAELFLEDLFWYVRLTKSLLFDFSNSNEYMVYVRGRNDRVAVCLPHLHVVQPNTIFLSFLLLKWKTGGRRGVAVDESPGMWTFKRDCADVLWVLFALLSDVCQPFLCLCDLWGNECRLFFFISISFSDLKNCVRNFSCMNSLNFSHHQVGS